jgi:multiple sugar transport system substrate-binding protein
MSTSPTRRARHRTRVAFAAAGVALLVLAATSSCSYFSSESGDPDTITLLTPDYGADNIALEKIVSAFEKKSAEDGDGPDGNGYKVDITYVPEDSYTAKFKTAMLAEPPDIAAMWDIFSFQPLDDLVYGANDIPIDGFNRALEMNCSLDGKIYCVGTNVGNMVLFYNKAIFDAAGEPYPDTTNPMTFEEYTDLAHRLTTPGGVSDSKVWGAANVGMISWTDPALLVDDTGRKVEATAPEFLGMAQEVTDSAVAGDMPTASQADSLAGAEGVNALFLDGKLAMLMADNYLIPQADEAGFDYGIAPAPAPAGTEPWVVTWTNSMGIPEGAKNVDGAADFLAFMATTGQDIQAEFGYLPLANAPAAEWANDPVRKQLVEINTLVRTTTVPQPHQGEWQSPLYDALDAAARGDGDLASLLAKAQPRAQQALDTSWNLYDTAMAERN